jgi:hypothetical protein
VEIFRRNSLSDFMDEELVSWILGGAVVKKSGWVNLKNSLSLDLASILDLNEENEILGVLTI